MKRLTDPAYVMFLIFIFLSLSNIALASADMAESPPDIESVVERLLLSEHVADEIIVKFNRDADPQVPLNVHALTGGHVKKEFRGFNGLQLVKVSRNISMKHALRIYLQDPHVEYAEPNYIVRAAVTPDDPFFSNLWGLQNTGQTGGTPDADIDAAEAWGITTGSDNVIIAVIDSGIAYDHPDLINNIWTNAGETSCMDGIDNDQNGYVDDCIGWDFIADDNDPTDFYGHGTHVAGTIAAEGNNSLGIVGVMWQAKIMALRFLGTSGSGTTDAAISAILYANSNGAHIINNSWGGGGFSQALKDAIDASPAVVVCAAGNDSLDNDASPFYPASYASTNIIAVAATDHNDALAYFSNYGATSVDLAAPGVSVNSTVPQFSYGTPVTLYNEDFNGSSGNLPRLGWSRGGTNSTWAITTGTGVGGTNSLEDSPGKSYRNRTDSWAGHMTPFTSVKDNLYTLSFQWKGTLESNYDYMLVNYSLDGATWDWVDFRTGSTGGDFISDSTNEITFATDIADSFYFGFGLYTDLSITFDGVYIDNVVLTRKPISIGNYGYAYYSGTSMAAPHVSGVAGLVKAFNPALSSNDIKNAVLNTVDPISSLSGKVSTGGRLNAFAALNSVPCPYQPVRILRAVPAYFATLQDAYDAAGDGETIQTQVLAFPENLNINLNKTVIMTGGYGCDYLMVIGMTTLDGSISVSQGTLTLENFILL